MSRRINLSEKYGLNPAVPKCFFCGEDKQMLILAGRMPGDAEAPHNVVWDHEPCDNCKKIMAAGIIVISVNEKLSKDLQNPYRTGGWCAVTDDYLRRAVQPPELLAEILKKRVVFMPDEVYDALGLPRGGETRHP